MNGWRQPATTMAVAAMAMTVTGGAAVRIWVAVNDPLWLDELHTSWVVIDDWPDVVQRSAIGHQTPVYFYVVKAVTDLFGHTEGNLRAVSLIAGTALMVAVAWLIYRWTRSWWSAWLAAALVAIDPTSIFYASEARPYALLQLMALIQGAWFFERAVLGSWPGFIGQVTRCKKRILSPPTWRFWLAFAALSALLIYLHPTALLLLAAEVTMLLTFGLAALAIRLVRLGRRPPPGAAKSWCPFQRVSAPTWLLASGLIVCVSGLAFWSLPGRAETWSIRFIWSEITDAGTLLTGDVLLQGSVFVLVWFLCWFASGLQTSIIWPRAALGAILFSMFGLTTGFAAALDYLGIAPLAFSRYTVVGLVFGWASLCWAPAVPLPHHAFRFALSLLTVLLVLFHPLANLHAGYWSLRPSTPWLYEQLVCQGTERWRMRFEDWKAVRDEIERLRAGHDVPVWLMAGLLEEPLVHLQLGDCPYDEAAMSHYLQFPLRGIYALSIPENIAPRIDMLRHRRGFRGNEEELNERDVDIPWIIIVARVSPESAEQVSRGEVETFVEHLKNSPLVPHPWRVRVSQVTGGQIVGVFSGF